ncbi:L-type lectin-domain containing receptor kinase IX.1-like [Cryptomeria japonica]|uniref:L-type lectin-domain containing receptor kinase IX.1-like n=1 Tax=Cryptomeria japonica TaxID=3369 RepID=UPI0027DA04C1|nr:L-type lectin-domain containing receptor kinase IX.1-like [Cryptomeria japonica]
MALVFSALCYVTAQAGTSVTFSFPPDDDSVDSHIRLFYDAYFRPFQGGVKLTTTRNNKTYSAGWAVYDSSIPIWSDTLGDVVSFTTHFQFIIKPDDNEFGSGGGLAFFMAPVGFKAPELSAGKYLGLFNNNTVGNPANQLLAVEFDTDQNSFDPNDNHVGIDVNTVVSEANATVMDGSLRDGKIWDAWVDYDGKAKKLQLFLSHNSTKLAAPILLHDLDLAKFLPQNAMVGFSASTSLGTNRHTLLSWNLSCKASWNASSMPIQGPGNEIPEVDIQGPATGVQDIEFKGKASNIILIAVIVPGLALCQGPRKFTFSELSAATKGFREEEKLGRGGFGSVYKGVLQESREVVAVKHISEASTQGKKEYVAEVNIISRLGHRNLVQLLGWCHEKGKFVLVYEFMPNGSLDKHIFGDSPVLYWNLRYNIACDIASAIVYLHEDWDQCILHRDIKSSNVMLDSDFNAKLGDFGLARLVKRDIDAASHTTLVAGTLGYLAPECFVTGKSNRESDVFSFGVVALEIACGRRALDQRLQENHNMRLIDWVWYLHAEGRILEAAAESLRDSKARPAMREVIKVLRLEASLPCIPLSMAVALYLSADPLQRSDELSSATLYRSCLASSSGTPTLPSEEYSKITVFSRRGKRQVDGGPVAANTGAAGTTAGATDGTTASAEQFTVLQSQERFPKTWMLIPHLTQAERDHISRCGLSSLLDMPQPLINQGLLIALAKRWHSEHNTFHLPTEEMTMTPEDVYQILQIPVMGDLVYYDLSERGGTEALCRVFEDDKIGGYDIAWQEMLELGFPRLTRPDEPEPVFDEDDERPRCRAPRRQRDGRDRDDSRDGDGYGGDAGD